VRPQHRSRICTARLSHSICGHYATLHVAGSQARKLHIRCFSIVARCAWMHECGLSGIGIQRVHACEAGVCVCVCGGGGARFGRACMSGECAGRLAVLAADAKSRAAECCRRSADRPPQAVGTQPAAYHACEGVDQRSARSSRLAAPFHREGGAPCVRFVSAKLTNGGPYRLQCVLRRRRRLGEGCRSSDGAANATISATVQGEPTVTIDATTQRSTAAQRSGLDHSRARPQREGRVRRVRVHTWQSHTWQSHTWQSHTWQSHTWQSHTWSAVRCATACLLRAALLQGNLVMPFRRNQRVARLHCGATH
jgi:hypothetical protein